MRITRGINDQWKARHKEQRYPPSKIYPAIEDRQQLALIAQLRMGHCSLNKYLYRFNIVDDPQCECGRAQESVKHYLIECPLQQNARNKLRKEAGAGGMRVEELLGNPKIIKATGQY